MLIDVNNLTIDKINIRKTKNSIRKILKLLNSNLNLSVVFVSPTEIKKINRRWRGKNTITDILSFGKLDFPIKQAFGGEIILCLKQIKKQAQKLRHPIGEELIWLLIHGILHLLEYDHQNREEEKKMNYLARSIFNKIFNN